MSRTAHRIDSSRFQRTDDAVDDLTVTRTFADLLLPTKITKGLSNAGFIHPSPIQWQALPLSTKLGVDLIVQSKSGTGKTIIYVATALSMINTDSTAIQALVIAPTREIAVQGSCVALDVAGSTYPDLKVHTFIGGLSITEDQVKLKKCHIAIGTPGRIKQLIEDNLMTTRFVRLLVLDEADRLMDSSFKNDVTWIFNQLPQSKQVMALSATYPEDLAKTLSTYMRDPFHVRLHQECQVLKGVSQYVISLPQHPQPREQDKLKFEALLSLLASVTFSQCLVFTNYITKAESFCEKLNQHGWPAIFIASSQDQPTRLRALNSLKQFQCRVLLTTDLTARGIDAQNVNFIVNLDVPWDPETYLHRIGRAGRFGSYGISVALPVIGFEFDLLRNIVHKTGSRISIIPFESGSSHSLPDLWKVQQVKNGISKSADVAEISVVENFALLEPLEELEEEDYTANANQENSASSSSAKSTKKCERKKKKTNGDVSEPEVATEIVGSAVHQKNETAARKWPKSNVSPPQEASEQVEIKEELVDYYQNGDTNEDDDEDYANGYGENGEACEDNFDENDENDSYYQFQEDTEGDVTDDATAGLPSDFVMKRYQRVTGYEFAPCDSVKMTMETACDTLKDFFRRDGKAAAMTDILSVEKLKQDVKMFLEDSMIEPEHPRQNVDPNPRTIEAVKVLQDDLNRDWARVVSKSGEVISKATDVSAVLQAMLSGDEEFVVSDCDNAADQKACIKDEKISANEGDAKTLEASNEGNNVVTRAKAKKSTSNKKPQSPAKSGYPEPYVANWQPVEDSADENEQAEIAGEVVWKKGDDLEAFDDESFETGNEVFGANFEFPFPDPDTVMAGYLGLTESWQATFPIWLEQVKRNMKIIEQAEFEKQIQRLKNL